MRFNQWSLLLIIGLTVQLGSVPPLTGDGLTAAERAELQRQQKIEGRIKVYQSACRRLLKTVETEVLKDDFQSVPDTLKSWLALLELAAQDIDKNESRKKKSKALIQYEILLRKEISDVQGFKIRAPVDQQDNFEAWLTRAEEIRKKFVDILFPG